MFYSWIFTILRNNCQNLPFGWLDGYSQLILSISSDFLNAKLLGNSRGNSYFQIPVISSVLLVVKRNCAKTWKVYIYILSPIAAVFFKLWSSISQLMLISCVFTYPKINWLSLRRSHYLVFWNVAVSTQSQIKKLLYKKEQKESRFLWNRAHSYCSFASLKWFRKTHVRNVFLINDDKILSSLLNL